MDDARVVMDTVGSTRLRYSATPRAGHWPLFAAIIPSAPRRSCDQLVRPVGQGGRLTRIGVPSATLRSSSIATQHSGVTAEILIRPAQPASNSRVRRRYSVRASRYPGLQQPPCTGGSRWVTQLDVRSVFPVIRVPTLVLHRRDNRLHRVAFGRYLAPHIAGARYVELDGADSFPFHAGDFTPVLDRVEQFLTGMRASPALNRTLATVLMTDIVDSTGCATRLGDHRWLELRAAHDRLVREQIAWYRGREVDARGFLAFDGRLVL
jgi:pimeloyl-ACP methyl ester carboxylesterase